MDHYLRCNSLRCRQVLTTQAVVTNCSHIFCVDCANKLFTESRTCPLCEISLSEPDDVCLTNLNPTDDYKTSVLSGLSPQTVLDVLSRSIGFWCYQATQEIAYHEHYGKSLHEKLYTMNNQLETVIRDSNAEITHLRNALQAAKNDLELEKKRNNELADLLHEKTKQCAKIQSLYDKMKRKVIINPLQSLDMQNNDENTYHHHQSEYHHSFAQTSNTATQRQQLYPHTPASHARSFGIRPASQNGHGQTIRSAAVSAAGRTPLRRLSTNTVAAMNPSADSGMAFSNGPKGMIRPLFSRK